MGKRPGRKPLGRTGAQIREINRLRRARQREAAKERAHAAAALARERGEQRVALNESGRVAMRLQVPLEVRTYRNEVLTFPPTTEVWARPGDVIDLEARGVATRSDRERGSYGVAIIYKKPNLFESPDLRDPRRGNTAAGY